MIKKQNEILKTDLTETKAAMASYKDMTGTIGD